MKFSCAATSQDHNESFIGTASPFRYALMIEYHEEFPESAIVESIIPEAVKKHILKLYETKSDVRILLIKKASRDTHKKLFWADCNPLQPELFSYNFIDYEDLLDIALGDINSPKWHKETQSQFFICTNGLHDPCCEKYGRQLFDAVQEQYPYVWQTTHIGGDRFAANMLTLPTGIYYRRVHETALHAIVQNHNDNHLYLPCFGGRTTYSPLAQAAEYFVREKTHITDLDRLHLEKKPDTDTVSFIDRGTRYSITLALIVSTESIVRNCHATTATPLSHYEVTKFWQESS